MHRFVLSAILAVSLCSALVSAQPKPALRPPDKLDPEAVDAYVAEYVRDKGFVGLSLAIMRDGKIIMEKGYGKIALNGAAVETTTPFAIGSVTKQFTCACILLLAEEGKLSVRDKVAKYYPDLTRAKDITLYDLMTHASGYPDYYPLDFLDRRMRKQIALDDLLKEYAGGKLDFEPGSRWSYSNTGFILLGRIVEKVSGETFGQFLEKRILKPLGMTHSVFEPTADMKGIARGHTSVLLGPAEQATLESNGWIHAAGGLYASAGDLAKWDLALMDGTVLKPESYQLMTTPRTLTSGKVPDYGCGLSVSRQSGDTVLAHGGAVSGFLAFNALIPRTKSAVVVLTNGEHSDLGALHRELVALVMKDEAKREDAVPVIAGPIAARAARQLFRQLQEGDVDRSKLGEEFSLYLTDERIKESAPRLKAYGEPTAVEVDGLSERGGMEASRIRLTFKSGAVKVNMFRSPDGKIQQFLLTKG